MASDPRELAGIQDAYIESFNFLQEWKRRKVAQLVLLNNMRRGDQNIASTLMLTLFNRVLSAAYDDKMQVKFSPTQGITQDQINAYNTLAQSDYQEMDMAKLDYDWMWDTLFFNRGYVETLRFSKAKKVMEPTVINPLVFGYDPYFSEIQDWRYYWKWITKSRVEIQRLIDNGTLSIRTPDDIPGGVDEYLYDYKQRRDQAKMAVEPSAQSQAGDVYQILEMYRYNPKTSKKEICWVDKGFSNIIWSEELKMDDLIHENPGSYGGDEERGSKWPLVAKEAFREPHSTIGFGIADLLEDKHRAKSVLLNLAYMAAKDRANPLYVYNTDLVTDVTQLFSRQVNQHIPVTDVEAAIKPLNTQDPMSDGLIAFISMMQQEANDPVGTSVAPAPEPGGKGTATEAAIDQQLNDMAQSLQSKVMQFGVKEFWSHWFSRYAKHGKDLGWKMANIVGVNGVESERVDLTAFSTDYPPGVLVYSAKEAEYKNLVKRRDFMELYPVLTQTLSPSGMRNFNKHVFMPLMVEDPSLIDTMFPDTIDELKATQENGQLEKEMLPEAADTDDHETHIYIHNTIPPGRRTMAMWFHIAQHEAMLADQKAQEQQAMAMEQQGQSPGQPKGNTGSEKRSTQGAAAPLKAEASDSPMIRRNK